MSPQDPDQHGSMISGSPLLHDTPTKTPAFHEPKPHDSKSEEHAKSADPLLQCLVSQDEPQTSYASAGNTSFPTSTSQPLAPQDDVQIRSDVTTNTLLERSTSQPLGRRPANKIPQPSAAIREQRVSGNHSALNAIHVNKPLPTPPSSGNAPKLQKARRHSRLSLPGLDILNDITSFAAHEFAPPIKPASIQKNHPLDDMAGKDTFKGVVQQIKEALSHAKNAILTKIKPQRHRDNNFPSPPQSSDNAAPKGTSTTTRGLPEFRFSALGLNIEHAMNKLARPHKSQERPGFQYVQAPKGPSKPQFDSIPNPLRAHPDVTRILLPPRE